MRLHSPFTGSRLNRRTIAAVAALALVSAPMVGQIPHASAFESWCWDDPVIAVNGHMVRVVVGVQGSAAEVAQRVQGAEITVSVPQGVSAVLVDSSSPYFPQHVSIVSGKNDWKPGDDIPVTVTVGFTAGTASDLKPDQVMTGAQVTADSDKTLLIHGHSKDKLHHDIKLHEQKPDHTSH